MRRAGIQEKIGEKRLGGPGRNVHDCPMQANLELTQQSHLQHHNSYRPFWWLYAKTG
jgi:hypothetical protein